MNRWVASVAASMVALSLIAPAQILADESERDDRLFQQLGGMGGIDLIVEELLVEISRDLRIVEQFAETNVERFRRLLVEQICDISGGPCEYSGDSMELVHGGMEITEAEFNALVENLITAMDTARVPLAAQNRLLRKLAEMRSDIIHQ
ncbi:group 1 truncated hemoglobin [Thioalkalivibrio sp. ALJ1]|uniref:group I truncated hemoglobin n=1 Tax=Thioalkalivibrio sp. ALJ1 TaxID=1158144 RepID=UPI000570C621|nr:group 1 truncated hemoglobin [Thioalkalivibrio sp. ALJ1]